MRAGALLPLRSYFVDYLNHVRIAPFQLHTNGYRVLAALKSMYHLQGWEGPSPQEICYLLALKRSPKENEGFYYLASWPQEKRLIEDMPNKAKDFKGDFFWAGALECKFSSFNRTRKLILTFVCLGYPFQLGEPNLY